MNSFLSFGEDEKEGRSCSKGILVKGNQHKLIQELKQEGSIQGEPNMVGRALNFYKHKNYLRSEMDLTKPLKGGPAQWLGSMKTCRVMNRSFSRSYPFNVLSLPPFPSWPVDLCPPPEPAALQHTIELAV
jgi:hypothetical protein